MNTIFITIFIYKAEKLGQRPIQTMPDFKKIFFFHKSGVYI